jgi:hypothetical protein
MWKLWIGRQRRVFKLTADGLVQGADPFAYATKAMAKMMEARNVGIATACFFEK